VDQALTLFRISQDWNPAHGPNPYQRGCFAPKELKDEAGIVMPPLIVNDEPGPTTPPARSPDINSDETTPPPRVAS
jgi:hypothetical protein